MSQDKEKVFSEKTKLLLDYLGHPNRYGETSLCRPFFIEFAGSPSSGKTTVIGELDKFLRRHGLRVFCPQEGAQAIRHIERTTPVYSIRAIGMHSLNFLLDLSYGHTYDVVILDRSVFDAYCWMIYYKERGKLTEEACKTMQSFFLSDLWTDSLDAVFFMVCDAEEAMKREMRLSLTNKEASASNPKIIAELAGRYREAFNVLSLKYKQLELIDTTNMKEYEVVERMTNKILDILVKKI
ncbi:MAG: AAA family ATPase [bacterium]